jgi:hypothetical protein
MKTKIRNTLGILGIVFILFAMMSLVYDMGKQSAMMEHIQ